MKNTTFGKILGVSVIVVGLLAVASLALPASAATVAGYYDQYGSYHTYQTYSYLPEGYYGYNGYNQNTYGYGYSNYGTQGVNGNYYINNGVNVSGRSQHQPKIWSDPSTTAFENSTYIGSISVFDSDNDRLSYQLIQGPTGMTVNPSTGSVSWQVPSGTVGQRFNVTVSVTDGYTAPVTQSFTITVAARGGYVYGGGNSTSRSAGGSGTTSNGSYTGSALNSVFGGGAKASEALAISNVTITSGPTNIYTDKNEVNCEVRVSWITNIASAGQVVYGTVSQSKIDTFSYPVAATEGNSYQKQHEVKLGCLENTTYYLRVVAFSTKERAVSDERTIFPIKIRTQMPSVSGSVGGGTSAAASVVGSLGAVLSNPWVILVLVGAIIYFFVARTRANSGGGHSVAAHSEPALEIPHH